MVALAAAIGVAVYLLRREAPAEDQRRDEASNDARAAQATEAQAPAAAERDRAAHAVPEPGAAQPAVSVAPRVPTPTVEELESELAAHPDQVLRRLADALPRGEREAQRLTLLEVRAHVARGEIGPARSKARGYFERWPGGPDTTTLEQLTGAHPTANAVTR